MVFCTNCQTEIEDSKMFLHEGFCKNNIRFCFKCKKTFPKNEYEEHLEDHKIKNEPEKKTEIEDKTQKQNKNQTKNKTDREYEINENNNNNLNNNECQYCSLLVEPKELEEHEKMCGARTVECEICVQYVQTRLLNQHLNVIHDKGFNTNNIRNNIRNKEKEDEDKKRRQIEEDEILARKLAEEYNNYNINNTYNSFRNF